MAYPSRRKMIPAKITSIRQILKMVRRSPRKIGPSPTANRTGVSRKDDTNAIGADKQAYNTMA
jgi:hypothetical protein